MNSNGSPPKAARSPPRRRRPEPQGKTMAYFLKDRPEGVPMPDRPSPVKKDQSAQRKHPNTRSQSTRKSVPRESISQKVAPRLKLVDGRVVLDHQMAPGTREELTAGMPVVQEEPNRYLTSATYSKRCSGSNRWSLKETDLFYEALSMCGTDFSMVATLFPHRNRSQIKGKFKIEERNAPHRISTALASTKSLDAAAFAAKVTALLNSK